MPTPDLAAAQGRHLDALARAYAKILTAEGYDGVLLYSGHAHRHFGDDQTASFAAFGHFLHWVPMAGLEHGWLLIRPGARPTLYFHAPADFWHLTPRLPEEAWVEAFEVELRSETAPPSLPAGRFAILGEVDAELASALGAEANPEALTRALNELRVHKSDYEVACLREANRRALTGHRAAREAFLAGGAELDCQLAYQGAARVRESELPYQNIVGLNAHGGVLHYQHYTIDAPARHRSLLLDGGHRYRGYCADITRTWPGPDADPAFAPLVEGVTTLQQRLVAALRPGVSYVELHERMHAGLGELLAEHGLVRCSPGAAVATGITRAFCPHGLGHLLGLQVHDVAGRVAADGSPLPPPAGHPALRLTRELEAGMVVTMEPGLYIIPMLLERFRDSHDIDWHRVEGLADHGGVRIEDNVLVTAQGPDNLTLHDAE
ncbi:Xaa-Pro dipeptidase [Halomonas sp. LBP4]|uniref:Xaa-Pro dipeptidase n=1 Tax=Halomonas sp. LBP4 TaxID=2044917 RepID=UPI000D766793|nr:Xaa-Pro dipeptidase [Halomonas sp. LBP4]PXX95368.1 Xaa-Pro dipeptidase [Halomonas sp. LBP4]